MEKKRGKFVSHMQLLLNKINPKDTELDENLKENTKSFNSEELNKPGLTEAQINLKDIPSRFLAYPQGAIIKYRPYWYGEIKSHDQSKNLSYREEVDFVLSGVYTNFPKYDLTLPDYLYISLLRRMSHAGNYELYVLHRCKKCRNAVRNIFRANEIDINYIEADKLPISVTFSEGINLLFKPLTIGAYLELYESGFKDRSVSLAAKCCINLPYEEAFNFLYKRIDPIDICLIERLDKLLYHSIKPLKLQCPHIDKEYVEKDGWTVDKLNEMKKTDEGKKELNKLFTQYNISYVEDTQMMEFASNDLVKRMALIKEIPCGNINSLELEGGDLFIGPFCDYGSIIETRIRYGY